MSYHVLIVSSLLYLLMARHRWVLSHLQAQWWKEIMYHKYTGPVLERLNVLHCRPSKVQTKMQLKWRFCACAFIYTVNNWNKSSQWWTHCSPEKSKCHVKNIIFGHSFMILIQRVPYSLRSQASTVLATWHNIRDIFSLYCGYCRFQSFSITNQHFLLKYCGVSRAVDGDASRWCIYASVNLVVYGSPNGLPPVRSQIITNAALR